jgi:hypothetical protein
VVIYEALKDGFVKGDYETWWLNVQIEKGNAKKGHTTVELKDVQVHCESYLGNGYGFFDLWNILIYILFRKNSFTFNPGSKRLICSEAVARVLYDASNKEIDFVKEFGKPYDMVTPADLAMSKQINWTI